MFRLNCLSSSRMPVGLVTLISVTKPPMTSSPTKIIPFAASVGPTCAASQRSRSFSGRPTPLAPAARLPRLSDAEGMRASAYGHRLAIDQQHPRVACLHDVGDVALDDRVLLPVVR